jgi:hypothetical protein
LVKISDKNGLKSPGYLVWDFCKVRGWLINVFYEYR